MESDSDFSAQTYEDEEFEEERGSFMSVVEMERIRRDPFKGINMADHYEKRQSTKRRSKGRHGRKSAKRMSTKRRSKKRVSKRRSGEELSVNEDMGLVIATIGLTILSVYHLVYSLSPHQISVVLGYGLVALGATSKLPYIRSLEKSQTAVGISDFRQYSDILAVSFTILFNVNRRYPFLAWGEKAFLLAQSLYVTSLVWKFRKTERTSQVFWCGAYACSLVSMFFGIKAIDAQYRFVIPMIKLLLSKPGQFQQVYLNFKNGHTGPQSGASQAMISVLKFLRLYTTVTEIGDPILILSAFIALGLNVTLLFQIIAYREKTARVIAEEQRQSVRL